MFQKNRCIKLFFVFFLFLLFFLLFFSVSHAVNPLDPNVVDATDLGVQEQLKDPSNWDEQFVSAYPTETYTTNPERAVELVPKLLDQPAIFKDFMKDTNHMRKYSDVTKKFFQDSKNAIAQQDIYEKFIALYPQEIITQKKVFETVIGADIAFANRNKDALRKYLSFGNNLDDSLIHLKGNFQSFDKSTGVFKTKGEGASTFSKDSFEYFSQPDITVAEDGSLIIKDKNFKKIELRNVVAQSDEDGNGEFSEKSFIILQGVVQVYGYTVSLPKNCKQCKVVFKTEIAEGEYQDVSVFGTNVPVSKYGLLKSGSLSLSELDLLPSLASDTVYVDKRFGTVKSKLGTGLFLEDGKTLGFQGGSGDVILLEHPQISGLKIMKGQDVTISDEQGNAIVYGRSDIFSSGKTPIPIIIFSDRDGIIVTADGVSKCPTYSACMNYISPETILRKEFISQPEFGTYSDTGEKSVWKFKTKNGIELYFDREPTNMELVEIMTKMNELNPTLKKSFKSIFFTDNYQHICGEGTGGCARLDSTVIIVPLKSQDGLKVLQHEAAHTHNERVDEMEEIGNTVRKAAGIDSIPTLKEQWTAISGRAYEEEKGEKTVAGTNSVTWKDGTNGPRFGCVNPYGCNNYHEDIATYVEDQSPIRSFSFWKDRILEKNNQIYEQKVNLLCQNSFLIEKDCAKIREYIAQAKQTN